MLRLFFYFCELDTSTQNRGVYRDFSNPEVRGTNVGAHLRVRPRIHTPATLYLAEFPVAFFNPMYYNSLYHSVRGILMNCTALTTASFFFCFGRTRFMGTGFFGMEKKG